MWTWVTMVDLGKILVTAKQGLEPLLYTVYTNNAKTRKKKCKE